MSIPRKAALPRKAAVALLAVSALAIPTAAGAAIDWGSQHEADTAAHSAELFGFEEPLAHSAVGDIDATTTPPAQQVIKAAGLKVEPVAQLPELADMMAFWPTDTNPTHAFVCIEQGRAEDGMNPGVVRVNLSTGKQETVVFGTDRCDGIRRTPWKTILFTEETSDGGAYEYLYPNRLAPVRILDRATGKTSSPRVVKRPNLGTFAWEGLEVYADGTVIAGDELRPEEGVSGGSIYKFVSTGKDEFGSPLAEGVLHALRVGGGPDETNYGQGAQTGLGEWVPLPDPADARQGADDVHATGFYRPEDLHQDPTKEGIAVCWANTGNSDLRNFGEVLCLNEAEPNRPEVQVFVLGNPELNQPDNLAFQPGTGILYVIEDNENGDVWACLPDGGDTDLQSDGCVRAMSVRDADAEPTGFTFDGSGRTAYLNVQHNDVEGLDPMLKVTGWTLP